jgi:hypothetical protein
MIKYTLLIFLFANLDTYTGNFHTINQEFSTYHECIEYVEQHTVDSTTGFGQVFTPTNQIIGLTYCKPIDIQ